MEQKSPEWKKRLYIIIFESDTPQGKFFDVALIFLILFSSMVVLMDSVRSIHQSYGVIFYRLEWFFTVAFAIEYVLRILCLDRKLKYVTSFFGVIDLLTILPTIVSLVFPNIQFLMIIRILRLLRLFRIFKMIRYMQESSVLKKALIASRPKITIFIFTMLFVITIVGAMMYIVEGEEYGFSSIPESMYWAVITVTTVGYGDITPHTSIGKFIASFLMIMAYGIIAVPTGIFSYELAKVSSKKIETRKCVSCLYEGNPIEAAYCSKCGKRLDENDSAGFPGEKNGNE